LAKASLDDRSQGLCLANTHDIKGTCLKTCLLRLFFELLWRLIDIFGREAEGALYMYKESA
jgi:hypothetical protein